MVSGQQRLKARRIRPKDLLYYERALKKEGCDLIIGVDEAGRGPLAGPVVAAAVALGKASFKNRIDDSKKLSAKSREKAFREITQKSIFGLGVASEKIIDRINILEATRQAMQDAVIALTAKVEGIALRRVHIIVDGNMLLDLGWSCSAIIRGDAKSRSIAAASILAKVTRDRIMREYDLIYPAYGFSRHKGYPTQIHRDILKRIGPSAIHRKSFHCV